MSSLCPLTDLLARPQIPTGRLWFIYKDNTQFQPRFTGTGSGWTRRIGGTRRSTTTRQRRQERRAPPRHCGRSAMATPPVGGRGARPPPDVTSEDLRRRCSVEHDAFALCTSVGTEGLGARCASEKEALERCTAMVYAINRSCGQLYKHYKRCMSHTSFAADCEPVAVRFFECADQYSPTPLRAQLASR